MGDVLNQIEEQVRLLRDWFYLMAIGMVVLVVLNAALLAVCAWGLRRVAMLSEMNRFPVNPAQPGQAVLFGGQSAGRHHSTP